MAYKLKSNQEYVAGRDINVLQHYVDDVASYIARTKGVDINHAKQVIKDAIKNRKVSFNDPIMEILRKDENRDRYPDTIRTSQFLVEVSKRKLIMAPTLTCYLPQSQMPSELGGFTHHEYKDRKRVKKEGQEAKSYGRIQESKDKNDIQNKKKELINSISGSFTIATTAIANRSGHSTLTSTCRTATAFANANTERLLAGHRYFESGEAVIENIVAVLSKIDQDRGREIIESYGLRLVSHAELLECLKYSYSNYWRSDYWDEKIAEFVQQLSELECTLYLYTGDLFHIKKFNESFIRDMIDEMHRYPEAVAISADDTTSEIRSLDDYLTMFVAGCMADKIGKLGIGNPKHVDKDYYGEIGGTILHLKEHFGKYQDLFTYFMYNDMLPANTAQFPKVIRKNVLGGDTDSTLFQVLNWTTWYHHGDYTVHRKTVVTSQYFIYLLCMLVKHSLSYTASIMGVEADNIPLLDMKNEYFFNVFIPSNRTKHYANLKGGCEGNNYPVPELEIKGVAYKNSKAEASVMDEFNDTYEELMNRISAGEKISYHELVDRIARVEARIFKSVMMGDADFLATRNIKVKEGYKEPMSSDYVNHVLWEEVFADKYGKAPALPYEAVRISVKLPNPTAINIWISSFEDKEIARKMRAFLDKTKRKGIASILLPYDTIAQEGIPVELKLVANLRKLIYANTEPYYIMLESFGIYMHNRYLSKMVLDERPDLLTEEQLGWLNVELGGEFANLASASKGKAQYDQWDVESTSKDDDEFALEMEDGENNEESEQSE